MKSSPKKWTPRAGRASFNESYQEAKVSVRFLVNIKARCELSVGNISITLAKQAWS